MEDDEPPGVEQIADQVAGQHGVAGARGAGGGDRAQVRDDHRGRRVRRGAAEDVPPVAAQDRELLAIGDHREVGQHGRRVGGEPVAVEAGGELRGGDEDELLIGDRHPDDGPAPWADRGDDQVQAAARQLGQQVVGEAGGDPDPEPARIP